MSIRTTTKIKHEQKTRKGGTYVPGKASAKEIKEAADRANFSLTDDEVAKLERGETVSVQQTKVQTVRGCSGIKIVDLGGGCGLYLNPFPPSISVCCET